MFEPKKAASGCLFIMMPMILFPLDQPTHQHRLSEFSELIYEYLLIISPDSAVSAALFRIKHLYQSAYGCEYAASLVPHLTLVNFVQLERNERIIVKHFERFSKNIYPFDIQLNGFGGFPQRTIYAAVSNRQPIVKIVKDVQIKFSKLLQPIEHSKPHFIKNPHITIARRMLEPQYNQAWEEWKNREFNAAFRATEITLLKRNITGGKCKTIATFPFKGNRFEEEQLSLPF
jgi:2'-5' RNA ligase